MELEEVRPVGVVVDDCGHVIELLMTKVQTRAAIVLADAAAALLSGPLFRSAMLVLAGALIGDRKLAVSGLGVAIVASQRVWRG